MKRVVRRSTRRPAAQETPSPAACLAEAERLFHDFCDLTPFPFKPMARSFTSFNEYEKWKRAQQSPWYR